MDVFDENEVIQVGLHLRVVPILHHLLVQFLKGLLGHSLVIVYKLVGFF